MGRTEMFRKRNTILKINKKKEKKNLILDKHYEKNTLRYKRPLLKIEQTFQKLEKAKHVDQIKTLIHQKLQLNAKFVNKYHSCVLETEQKPFFQKAILSNGDLDYEYVNTADNTNTWYLPEKTALCFNLDTHLQLLKKMKIEETTGHLQAGLKESYENYLILSPKERILEDIKITEVKSIRNISSDEMDNIKAACCTSSLPAVKQKALLELIDLNQIVVAGSSRDDLNTFTEVPLLLLRHVLETPESSRVNAIAPRIVCTTPHFLTAQLGAKTMSRTLKDTLHTLVELDVGFKKKRCPDSLPPIVYCNTHQLVYHMLDHPALSSVSHVILDRAQHRDDMFDLILTYLRQHLLPQRRDLKLIVLTSVFFMDILTKHLNVPVIKLSRRVPKSNPVQYLETILKAASFVPSGSADEGNIKIIDNNYYKDYQEKLEKHVNLLRLKGSHSADLISNILNPELEGLHLGLLTCLLTGLGRSEKGCILVFLPNSQTIARLYEALIASEDFPSDTCAILKYHSKITKKDSQYMERVKEGKTVIILASDAIEVLDSIQGVRHIVDCGCYEKTDFLAHFNIETRQIDWTTRHIADERKLWCEKRSSTKFYRVYTSVRGSYLRGCCSSYLGRIRPDHLTYLIKRLNIDDVNGFLEHLDIKPQHRSVHLSIKRYQALNMMDDKERLTPLGYSLSCLPLPPHLSRLAILGCIFSCLDPVLSIVAVLLHHDPFDETLTESVSSLKRKLSAGCLGDHMVWVRALSWYENLAHKETKQSLVTLCDSAGLLHDSLALLCRVKGYLLSQLVRAGYARSERCDDPGANVNAACDGLIRAIVYAGLYPNVAVIRSPTKIVLSKLVQVIIHPSSVLHLTSAEDAQCSSPSKVECTPSSECFLAYSTCYGTDMGLPSEQVFIRDVTLVSSLAVILFSHDFHIPVRKRHKFSITDKAYHFRCDNENAVAFIERLRLAINQIIETCVVDHSCVDWTSNSRHVHVLRCVVELIENKNNVCNVWTLERKDIKSLKHRISKKEKSEHQSQKKKIKR